MEYWKHPSQGKIQSFDGEFEKHPEKKEELESQGWFRVKGRDWSAFKAKKSYKKKKKK